MKNIKKIKIKINGKLSTIKHNTTLFNYLVRLKVPIKKVSIELNEEIVNKKQLRKIKLKTNDKIEVVHFIGGG